jgi:uncharacterized membrane protein YdbT with pleckstrin-like domain
MRLIAPGPVVPVAAGRYLLPHEQQVITVRQHQASLLPALTVAVGGLLAAEAVNGIAAGVRWARFVVWVLAGFLVVRAIVDALAWYVRYIVITDKRLILISGILSRKATGFPLQALQNLGLTRSAGGRLLGYGAFTFEADGQARAVLDYIPYPEQIYLEIYHLLYPAEEEEEEKKDDSGDDGGPGGHVGLGWPGGPGEPDGPDLDFDDL